MDEVTWFVPGRLPAPCNRLLSSVVDFASGDVGLLSVMLLSVGGVVGCSVKTGAEDCVSSVVLAQDDEEATELGSGETGVAHTPESFSETTEELSMLEKC